MSVFTVEIFLVILALGLLCFEAFVPAMAKRVVPSVSLAGVSLAFILYLFASKDSADLPEFIRPFHELDTLAVFYKGFAMVSLLLVLRLTMESKAYVMRFIPEGGGAELYSLPILVCVGSMWMASAKDLVTMFVSLELTAVAFYVLVAMARKSSMALEAGVKYLILGALSTGILIYGIAWVYGTTDSMSFAGMAEGVKNPAESREAMLLAAALLISGLGFKVAAAPFHVWVPDVYQGAPTPVTAYLSIGSKAAGFLFLTRIVEAFTAEGSRITGEVQTLLVVLGSVTVLLGSLPAIFQTQIKRLLAYSSVSHAGYLLLVLSAVGAAKGEVNPSGVVAFYLATYLPMTALAFLVLTLMRASGKGEHLNDFRGLAKQEPLLAIVMTVALASLAGIPLTAGFFGKLFVFVGLIGQGLWVPITCAIIGAGAGFYYYLKIILVMYSPSESDAAAPRLQLSVASKVFAIGLAVVIVVLGVYPQPLQVLLQNAPSVVAHP